MRILTLIPDDSLRALRAAIAPSDLAERHPDAASIAAVINDGESVDAIVIDPTIVNEADWVRLRPMLASPDLPVLLYAQLTETSVQRIVAASGIGVHEVLLRNVDDDPAAIRRRLETLGAPAPPARVLAGLAEHLGELPAQLQGVTVPLFCAGPVPRWADDVARAAGIPRRSIDRWMSRAGLAGTATLLDVARLARVWAPIVDRGLPPAEVAVTGGFRRARMLAGHARRIVDCSPTLLGTRLTADEFVRRLVRHARRD